MVHQYMSNKIHLHGLFRVFICVVFLLEVKGFYTVFIVRWSPYIYWKAAIHLHNTMDSW